jgi:hypothetical protein
MVSVGGVGKNVGENVENFTPPLSLKILMLKSVIIKKVFFQKKT